MIDASGPLTEAKIRARLAAELAHEKDHGVQYWPIFLKSSSEFAGCCGLRPYRPEDAVYELGFHLRPQFWRQGLAEEAARAVVEYAFADLGARALFAGHHPENVGSKRLLEKLGFRNTGLVFYPPTGLDHPSWLLSREIWSVHEPLH